MTARYSGRLELTWTNKDRTLLAHDDQTYEWVDPADFRVSEVRLLRDVSTFGDTAPESNRSRDNLLIRGDALHALNALSRLPEFAKDYVGKVKLCYIDPPFNTGQAFANYDDALEHSVWLTMMRDRLVQIRDLLAPDGSVWVHLDDAELHRCRVVLDEIFGSPNFVTEVVWEKTDSPRMDAQQFSTAHDTILVYAKSPDWVPNRRSVDAVPQDFKHTDADGERYSRRELRKWGSNSLRSDRPTMWYPIEAPDGSEVWPIRPDGKDGYWRWKEPVYLANMDRIDWVDRGSGPEPYVKTYMATGKKPLPPKSVWRIKEVGGNPAAKAEIKALFPDIEPFKTPKPERFISEVLRIGSNPGDLVLDCYAGSGTTATVAHKMGRRWVTSEWSPDTVAAFTMPRLRKVVANEDPGGITSTVLPIEDALPDGVNAGAAKDAAKVLGLFAKAGLLDEIEGVDETAQKTLIKTLRDADKTKREVVWSGGGSFRVLDVGPSMFEEVDGQVYLADWAVNGALAEAVAAQVGFAYESDGPFSGVKGKSRLAVVDGLVSDGVVRLLLDALPDGQTVSIYGTAIEPEARDVLRDLRRGSTLRKIPSALLSDYRKSSAYVSALTTRLDEVAESPAESTDSADAKVND